MVGVPSRIINKLTLCEFVALLRSLYKQLNGNPRDSLSLSLSVYIYIYKDLGLVHQKGCVTVTLWCIMFLYIYIYINLGRDVMCSLSKHIKTDRMLQFP